MPMIDPEEIDESQVDGLIEELSNLVITRGLETPAIMFLEMNKPLGFIASQSVIVASPFLAPIFGLDKLGQVSKLLSNRDYLEKLITTIEKKASNKDKPSEKE